MCLAEFFIPSDMHLCCCNFESLLSTSGIYAGALKEDNEKKVYSEIVPMAIPKGQEDNPMWLDYVKRGWKCSVCQTQTSWSLWVCASCGAHRPEGYKKPDFLDKAVEEKGAVAIDSTDNMDDDDGFDPDGSFIFSHFCLASVYHIPLPHTHIPLPSHTHTTTLPHHTPPSTHRHYCF